MAEQVKRIISRFIRLFILPPSSAVIGDGCVGISCDGVCELVILQMQNPPGTALRPPLHLQPAVEKRHFHKVENIKAASVRASLNVFKLVHKNAIIFQLYRPVVK